MTGSLVIDDAGPGASWLVMVHGLSQDHRVFSAQVAAFRQSHRILLVDLPGHGLAADLPGPFGHRELARHVAGALEANGVDRCDYWGTHTGTALGLLRAVEDPARILSLILEGPVLPGHAMPSVDRALRQVRTVARSRGLAAARRYWFEEAGWFDAMRRDPVACRADAHRAIVEDFRGAPWLTDETPAPVAPVDAALAALDLPVLLYNGARDLPDFIAAADRLQALLPRVQRATIPGAGCFPAWECPQAVNRLAKEFLDQR